MSGLLKNNLFAAFSNIKIFSVIMACSGIFVIAVISQPLLFSYVIMSMVGFSFISLISYNKENASKWSKYKLTAPVQRMDIIKSYFFSQIIWLTIGMVIALIVVGFSVMLHGILFDRNIDFLLLMAIGISVSLLMNAIFFPLCYVGDGEKNETLLVISLILAVGILMGMSSFINWYFDGSLTEPQQLIVIACIILFSFACFFLSVPLTAAIFKRKEF